jgi:hypothetical protein
MTCARHPAAGNHRGHCAACLLENAIGQDPQPPVPQTGDGITIQLPLGRTLSSSVLLVRSNGAPFRLLRMKTWHAAAPSDFMSRFQRLQRKLSEWNDAAVRAPLAAWVDASRRASVLSEFSQGVPIIDRVQSGGLDPDDAEACLNRLRDIICTGHRRGLVHGSLGSGNIIVTARCARAYLLDFGHAALMAREPDCLPAPDSDLAGLDRLTVAIRAVASRSRSL